MTAASADIAALAANMAAATGMNMTSAVHKIIVSKAEEIKSIAESLAPFKTGKLRASISVTYPSPTTAVIGPGVFYGRYQEFGTGSRGEFPGSTYTITPVKAKTLAFTVGGNKVFTKKVTHPGVKPHPYMRPAFEQALRDFVPELASLGAVSVLRGPRAT